MCERVSKVHNKPSIYISEQPHTSHMCWLEREQFMVSAASVVGMGDRRI